MLRTSTPHDKLAVLLQGRLNRLHHALGIYHDALEVGEQRGRSRRCLTHRQPLRIVRRMPVSSHEGFESE